jgi:hypothetical protein
VTTARRIASLWLLFAVACAADPASRPTPTVDAQGAPGRPNVAITKPINGASIDAGDVKVKASVTSFDVVDRLGEAPADGEGHIHYYLDAEQIPTAPGEPAVTDDGSTYHATAKTSHTWKDVEPGPHTFAVQLVNNDHTPLEPPITAATTVTVRDE